MEFKTEYTDITPVSVFLAVTSDDLSDIENHTVFIDRIREALFKRFGEERYIPSVDALKFHWRRSCWVAEVWQQADQNIIVYPDLNMYGWSIKSNKLHVIWDTEENIENIKKGIRLWTDGCSCKTSCVSLRCGCKKRGSHCCPGCKCGSSCKNNVHKQVASESCPLQDCAVANPETRLNELQIQVDDNSDLSDQYSDEETFYSMI